MVITSLYAHYYTMKEVFFISRIYLCTTLRASNFSMLQRVATRGGTLRQVSRAAQDRPTSPFTTLTKIGARIHSARHIATGRGEADWTFRPRAIMSSNLATPSRVAETENYLDYTSRSDIDFERINSNMSCKKFHDSIWGFVVRHILHSLLFRCCKGASY